MSVLLRCRLLCVGVLCMLTLIAWPRSVAAQLQSGPLPAAQFAQMLDSLRPQGPVQLIDTRTAEEYQRERLPDARLIAHNGANSLQQLQSLDSNRPVLVYCLSGGRSSATARQLRAWGYAHVYELQGGLLTWRAAGLPLQGPAAPAANTPATSTVTQAHTGAVSPSEYQRLIRQPGKLVLVDVFATWCGPCKMMDPHLKALAAEQAASLALVKVDADQSRDLATQLGVTSLPTLLLYRDGQLLDQQLGYRTLDQLKTWVAQQQP